MSVFTVPACRLYQFAYRAFRPRRTERQTVEDGTGAVFSAAQLLRLSRLRKPMVVCAAGDAAAREKVLHALVESDIEYALWDADGRGAAEDSAQALRLAWARAACDSFIALGDAGTIDLVKVAAALAATRGRRLMSLVGRNRLRRSITPTIAIPTAGSGAESLAWASFTDAGDDRHVIADSGMIPPYLIDDPELLETVSRPTLARAVFDGLCLAVEAYLSGFADDASRACAADAVRGFLANAEPCWNSGGTLSQRSALMTASRLAGEAASRTGPGYARALSRSAARVLGDDPGDLCAVLLPAVLAKYGNRASRRLSELAGVCGLTGETPAAAANALIDRMRQLAFRLGLPEAVDTPAPDAIRQIGERAASVINPRCACPAVWTSSKCAAVFRAACGVDHT